MSVIIIILFWWHTIGGSLMCSSISGNSSTGLRCSHRLICMLDTTQEKGDHA